MNGESTFTKFHPDGMHTPVELVIARVALLLVSKSEEQTTDSRAGNVTRKGPQHVSTRARARAQACERVRKEGGSGQKCCNEANENSLCLQRRKA